MGVFKELWLEACRIDKNKGKITSYSRFDRFFIVGLASLIWFLLRTGTKPSRIQYPCQRAALTNASLWLAIYVVPLAAPLTRIFAGRRIALLLALAALVAAGFATYMLVYRPRAIQLEIKEWTASEEPASSIFVVTEARGRVTDLATLIELMGERGVKFYKSDKTGENAGPDGLIAADDVVIIKVNSQWDERGGTNTDLVKSLIHVIISHPDGFRGEIIIADNGQAQYGSRGTGGSLNWERNNAEDTSQSMQKVADFFAEQGYRVSTYLWDTITLKRVREYSEGDMEDGYVVYDTPNPRTGVIVSYPKFRTKYGTYISFKLGVWDPERREYNSSNLKVINVPVLKTHSIYGVTACVKHYMGVVSDRLTDHNPHNSVGRGGMGTVMVETRMPVLNILDAIWINPHPRGGPSTPYDRAVRVNIVAASRDPVALDYWASKYVLMPVAKQLGYWDLSTIDPDNTAPGYFGYWLRLSMEELTRAGYLSTVEEGKMNVYVRHAGG